MNPRANDIRQETSSTSYNRSANNSHLHIIEDESYVTSLEDTDEHVHARESDANNNNRGSQQQTSSNRKLTLKQESLFITWLSNYRKRWRQYWTFIGDKTYGEFLEDDVWALWGVI